MAMQAKDGTPFHSASRARLHDDMAMEKENASKPPAKMAGGDGASKDMSHMDIGEVVAKHGPATKVEVVHDHEAGAHHVTSHHRGAHHKSTHGSPKEAHEHGMIAAGHEPSEDEETYGGHQTPDDEGAEAGQSIPGLG